MSWLLHAKKKKRSAIHREHHFTKIPRTLLLLFTFLFFHPIILQNEIGCSTKSFILVFQFLGCGPKITVPEIFDLPYPLALCWKSRSYGVKGEAMMNEGEA
jgi:hypothetical protein